MGHSIEKVQTIVEGKGSFPIIQDLMFLRDSFSTDLESMGIPPQSMALIFSALIARPARMQFNRQYGNRFYININSQGDNPWDRKETLNTLSLFPHEQAHLKQHQMSENRRKDDQWSYVWLVPKFLIEGYAMLQERFSSADVFRQTIFLQSPMHRVLRVIDSQITPPSFSYKTFEQYLLGDNIENYQLSLMPGSSPVSVTTKYLEHLLLYISLCGLRKKITPEQIVTTMKNNSRVGEIAIQPNTQLTKKLLEPFDFSIYPADLLVEAQKIEDETQSFYYQKTPSLNENAYLARQYRNHLRDHKLTFECLSAEETLPITKFNMELMLSLLPHHKDTQDLLKYTNTLSRLLFKWGEDEYNKFK